MKFVDEATISVQAGNGGHGCLSFRREKFVERGGPDGGDGGDGGNVFLVANVGVNTLADFRVARKFKAGNGQSGAGRNKTGKSGDDLDVIVPCGTVVNDVDTDELLGDLTEPGQRLMIAEAGRGGLGNTRFKSSTNRAPRKTTHGSPGEKRHLMLELKLLADVGLLGLPNAGKSTLIRSMSAARPKVADYPFTTLHPNLGVVAVGPLQSFVMADVPGLIEGAADGAGLGIQFLKHLQRTKLLLHLVDIAPIEPCPEQFRGPRERPQIGLALLVDGRGHGHDVKIGAAQIFRIVAKLNVEPAQLAGVHFPGVIPAGAQLGDPALGDIEPDYVPLPGHGHGHRQAHIAQSHHRYPSAVTHAP